MSRPLHAGLVGVAIGALMSAPVSADVKRGVDAWSDGDFVLAVSEWQGPAQAGDADALFNLAQAYRLGRGVDADIDRARELYAEAAQKGHLRAANNYGLLLFQQGEQRAAMPFIKAAADRGDPRAQYVLGLAHFNADYAAKDWVRAYALVTLAQAAGLPQAAKALATMDQYISVLEREEAQALARQLEFDATQLRAKQLVVAELDAASADPAATPAKTQVAKAAEEQTETSAAPDTQLASRTSPTFASAANAPVWAPIGGTQLPGSFAGQTNYSQPVASASQIASTVAASAKTPIEAAKAPTKKAPTPVSAPPASVSPAAMQVAATQPKTGPWSLQLGAFGVHSNADKLWRKLSGNPALAGANKKLVPAGRLRLLQATGFESRSAATRACAALKRQGQDCLVKKT
ncbi:MAG: SPOR domain-containing protein [Pseudomonadota bacterium]